MKRVCRFFISSVLLALFLVGLVSFLHVFKHRYTADELININTVSKSFMDQYFEDYTDIANLSDEKKENVLIVTTNNLKNDYGASNVVEGPNGQFFLAYDSKEDKDKALNKFKKSSDIVSVDENNRYQVEANSFNSWGITKTGLDVGIASAEGKSLNSVVVAVIDTGLDTELFNSYYPGKLAGTYDVFKKSTIEMVDTHGHGTHVSGTVAEGTPDNVKVLAIRSSSSGSLYDSDIIAGINYAASYENVQVINMSFGGTTSNSSVEAAIQAANANNIISVAAAGNESSSANHFPSNYDNVISISALNSSKTFDYSYSNFGNKVAFAMPGTGIRSILGSNTTLGSECRMSNNICSLQGTSMATPHAAAAVAILKSYNDELTYHNVMTLLLRHTEDLGDPGRDKYYGYGMINFSDAVFCNNENCDEFGVFERGQIQDVKDLTIDEINVLSKNYGSEYNLYATPVTITHSDGSTEVRDLWEFSDFEITNYDPYNMFSHDVTIKVLDKTFTLPVINVLDEGWEYSINDGKVKLTKYLDNEKHIDNLVFPNKIGGYPVTSIDSGALGVSKLFKDSINYTYFRKMYLPSSITDIGDYTFANSSLTSIEFASSSVSLGRGAFQDSNNLTDVVGKINTLGIETFLGCKKLVRVTLDDSLTIIPKKAFYQTTNLTNVVLPESLITIGEDAFVGSGLTMLSVPKNVTSIDPSAFIGAKDLVWIEVHEDNAVYNSEDDANAIIETNSKTLIKGTSGTVIPSSVEKIGPRAFAYSPVENVVIPESVTEIANEAFYEANKLVYVVVPKSVDTIGTDAFKNTPDGIGYPEIRTFYDSYAKTYAATNKIPYKSLNPTYINVSRKKIVFTVGETVNPSKDLNYIDLYYPYSKVTSSGYSEYSEKRGSQVRYDGEITVTYKNGNSLKFGDDYYTVSGVDNNGVEFSANVSVTVEKATPDYIVPEGLEGVFQAKLSTVSLPSGFTWEAPTTIISKCGVQTFLAKFTPADQDNYKIVEHISITINVPNPRTEIVPEITLKDKTYDGTKNVDGSLLEIANLLSTEYTITSITTKDVHAGMVEADVKIKLTNSKYESYSLGEGLQEYTYTASINVLPKKLDKPLAVEKTYTYNGNQQEFEMTGFDKNTMAINGQTKFNAGTQQVTITPISSDYIWADGTSDAVVFTFTIEKAPIEYVYEAENITLKYDGLNHSVNVVVTSPASYRIRYLNSSGEYSLTSPPSFSSPGKHVIKFRIYVDDNYTDTFGEVTLTILGEEIGFEKETFEGLSDGEEHTITITPDIEDAIVKYSLDGETYNLDVPPKYKEPGEYKIYYQISLEGYDTVTGYEVVKIYGIKSIGSYVNIYNDSIMLLDANEYSKVVEAFDIFAPLYTFTHLDKNKAEYTDDKIKTGDFLKIALNGTKILYYEAAFIGDANGDGKISSLDYVRIKNHIMTPGVISGDAYLKAADANSDGKISSLDYVRIKNWIMKGEK